MVAGTPHEPQHHLVQCDMRGHAHRQRGGRKVRMDGHSARPDPRPYQERGGVRDHEGQSYAGYPSDEALHLADQVHRSRMLARRLEPGLMKSTERLCSGTDSTVRLTCGRGGTPTTSSRSAAETGRRLSV